MKDLILCVRGLAVSFRTDDGMLKAVRGIDLELFRGETLAIVGESGSGKSVSVKAMLGILARNAAIEGGEIIFEGTDLLKMSERQLCRIRGSR